MPSEQKPKLSKLVTARLILAAIILIFFATVLGVAGYLMKNKPVVSPEPAVLSVLDIIISTPEITPNINDSIDNWETYRNEEHEFELKYPSFFYEIPNRYLPKDEDILKELGTGIDYNNDNGEASIKISIKQKEINLENIVSPYENKIEKKDIKNIVIDGKQSYFYLDDSGASCGGSIVLIPNDNQTFQISFMDCQIPPGANYNLAESYADKILSTFKFIKIEKDETENWQTYTNEKYGFELFFPVSWKGVRRVISDNAGIETILFELPTSDKTWEHGSGYSSLFSLNIELKEDWLKTNSIDDMHRPYIYNNEKYVFEFDTFGNQLEDLSDINISEVVSTFHFVDRIIFGNLSAYTKRETDYNYVILFERGKEIIVDEKTANLDFSFPDFRIEKYGNFGDLVFSPKGNYLLYSEAGHEYIASNVYEIKNKKKILTTSADSETGVGFTPDEKYFYACAWSGMGSTPGGLIYNIPDFKVVYNTLSSTSCRYELESDSVIFFQDLGHGVINDTVRYSLKEQKEYKLYKEASDE